MNANMTDWTVSWFMAKSRAPMGLTTPERTQRRKDKIVWSGVFGSNPVFQSQD
jgi:hypothetical protein